MVEIINLSGKSLYKYPESMTLKQGLEQAVKQDIHLQGANLQRANLYWAKLQRADLQGTKLQGANLQDANLQGADLQRAYLQGADLQRAKLQGADLQRADLRNADLQGANLQNADLQGADLQGANLRMTRGLDSVEISPETNLKGIDLLYHRDTNSDEEVVERNRELRTFITTCREFKVDTNLFQISDKCGYQVDINTVMETASVPTSGKLAKPGMPTA